MGILYTIPQKYARGGWSCAFSAQDQSRNGETERAETLSVSYGANRVVVPSESGMIFFFYYNRKIENNNSPYFCLYINIADPWDL